MPAISEQELKAKIKTNFSDAYLLYGEETYLTKLYTDKLIKVSVAEGFEGFNLHIFEADSPELDTIYENAMAIPMMSDSKCVVVKEFPIDECEENTLSSLETLLSENPDDNTLIFCYPTVQPKGKNFNAMVKLFDKYGVSVKFGKMTAADFVKSAESGAKKRGKLFEPGAANYLISCLGSKADINLLINELDKLCAYADGDISKKDIDTVCAKSLEEKTFDMLKDLLAGRFDPAFRKLSALFSQREDPYMILGAMISQYADMYRAKAAVKSGGRASELTEYYPSYKKAEFRLDKASSNSSRLSFEQLENCIEILNASDLALKSTSADKEEILEQTLVKLARAGSR